MEELKNRFLYAGLSREEYLKIEPFLIEENESKMRIFSLLGTVGFAAVAFLSSMGVNTAVDDVYIYASAAVAMIVIFAVNEYLIHSAKANPNMETDLICLFLAVMYMEAFAVTLHYTSLPALTYIIVLLVLPLLFIERPYRIILVQIVSSIVFCLLALALKGIQVMSIDIWDTVTVLIPSIASILFVVPLRVGSRKTSFYLDYLNMHDRLTGLMNYNAYEEELEDLSGDYALVLADVNGLQEMNSVQGHEAGDTVLRTVAARMQENFGDEAVYRNSGIEFTAICPDKTSEEIAEAISRMEEEFAAFSCHVFFSTARSEEEPDADPHEIVKIAAKRMSEAKTAYYSRRGLDRRRR